jgi:hypothetical protein
MNAVLDLEAPWDTFLAAFRARVESAARELAVLSDAEASARRALGKWSRKEIVGHLVDSASNNHQRFVRAAFQEDLVFPGYDQEAWLALQRYSDAPWRELVALWRAYNLHLARVVEVLPAELRTRATTRHAFDRLAWRSVAPGSPQTLEWFIRDYAGHLDHHLRQALGA